MNSIKSIKYFGESEFNLKNECIDFIKGQRKSGILSKMIFQLKKDIPNTSNHEAIEILLDYNERLEKKDELNKGLLSELKRVFSFS